MLKRTTVVLVVVVCAGTAYGKANKIKFFTPEQVQIDESEAALGPDADPDGMAILNYASGADKTIIQIMVSDMTPDLSYSVQLTGCTNDPVSLDALVTDEEGSGTLHQERSGDVSRCDVELFVGASRAGPIGSQLPDITLSPYASTAVASTGSQNLADDFGFTDETTILAVRWFGGTFNGDATQTFRITIYQDASGIPGGPVFGPIDVAPDSSTLTGRQMDGQPSDSGDSVPDEFEFSATLVGGFTALAGVTYWLEIGGIRSGSIGLFNWTVSGSTTGDGNDGSVRQFVDTGTPWTPIPEDRAFELDGEVDSTELRATGINPG